MKIAVLGSAPSSKMLAPFHDKEWEIWSCSDANGDLPRIDTVFELHDISIFERDPSYGVYGEWLKKQPKVYMIERREDYPGSIVFPKDEMVKKFGPYFFSSTLAWMLAFAIHQEPEAIGIFGVDMTAEGEYGLQRPGCQYFIQKCHDLGIKVVVPPDSDIAQPSPLYGYKEADRMYRKLFKRRSELLGRLNEEQNQVKSAGVAIRHLEGALEDINYVLSTWAYQDK